MSDPMAISSELAEINRRLSQTPNDPNFTIATHSHTPWCDLCGEWICDCKCESQPWDRESDPFRSPPNVV